MICYTYHKQTLLNMKDKTLKHFMVVHNIRNNHNAPLSYGFATFETDIQKDSSYIASLGKIKLSTVEALKRADWFDTNNEHYDKEARRIVRNAIDGDTLKEYLFCFCNKELYKDKFCSEYYYFLEDGSLNDKQYVVARITYDSNGYLVDVVLDFYGNLASNACSNLICTISVQDKFLNLFPFFSFYMGLKSKEEFEGGFSKFLDCEKTEEFVTMFRLLNY